jgi:hypothetical protein
MRILTVFYIPLPMDNPTVGVELVIRLEARLQLKFPDFYRDRRAVVLQSTTGFECGCGGFNFPDSISRIQFSAM